MHSATFNREKAFWDSYANLDTNMDKLSHYTKNENVAIYNTIRVSKLSYELDCKVHIS